MEKRKTKITKAQRKAFASIGRIGGKATYAKMGSAHMSKIGKKGAEARKAKLKEKQG